MTQYEMRGQYAKEAGGPWRINCWLDGAVSIFMRDGSTANFPKGSRLAEFYRLIGAKHGRKCA